MLPYAVEHKRMAPSSVPIRNCEGFAGLNAMHVPADLVKTLASMLPLATASVCRVARSVHCSSFLTIVQDTTRLSEETLQKV